tara:strand:- start:375 stop:1577 length:1203 start_codon:yes stop_codon:yes gene_type:complete
MHREPMMDDQSLKSHMPDAMMSIPDGTLDLGWGHQSSGLHPVEAIRNVARGVLESNGLVALQYGPEQGFGALLEELSAFLSDQDSYTKSVEPDSLFLTAGASGALDLACTALMKSGDVVFVEEPTYYPVSRMFHERGLEVIGVPTDNSGIRTDLLREMLDDPKISRPVALYTIPSFHNPASTVLPVHRRQELVELAERHEFVVLSDDVYQLLHYDSLPPPPIITFDNTQSGCAISLGSFSKVLAPGLRLGWIQANPELLKRFVNLGLLASGGGLSQFSAVLVQRILRYGLLADNIDFLRKTYAERIQVLAGALRSRFGDLATFDVPAGGYFFWVTFPSDVDTQELLPVAQEHGVSYRPGSDFSQSGMFSNSLRISFSLYDAADLELSVKRLSEALKEYRS